MYLLATIFSSSAHYSANRLRSSFTLLASMFFSHCSLNFTDLKCLYFFSCFPLMLFFFSFLNLLSSLVLNYNLFSFFVTSFSCSWFFFSFQFLFLFRFFFSVCLACGLNLAHSPLLLATCFVSDAGDSALSSCFSSATFCPFRLRGWAGQPPAHSIWQSLKSSGKQAY